MPSSAALRAGRQAKGRKAQTEAKTCFPPHPDEFGGREIGGQEAFGEETCGQEDVREAEAITSGTLGLCRTGCRLALAVAIIGAFLRHSSFVGLRDDKEASEIVRE